MLLLLITLLFLQNMQVSLYLYLNMGVVMCVYLLAHQCNFPGCKIIIVLDGNQKNRRAVCAATEAGFIEYSSLPGTIKSGCQSSPGRQSKFCYNHVPRVSQHVGGDDDADKPGEAGVVMFIAAKKQTRQDTYYQACKSVIK